MDRLPGRLISETGWISAGRKKEMLTWVEACRTAVNRFLCRVQT